VIKDVFIGIDGGGTKTKAIAEDINGIVLGRAKGGPANIRLSVEKAWHSILTTSQKALDESKIKLNNKKIRFHACFALAGTEIPQACQNFLKKKHPFTTIMLVSDAYAAAIGAHEGKDGAIIIIGTGVAGYSVIDQKGHQINGWGFPHADEGGGAYLGLKAIRLSLKWLDGRGKKTALLARIFQHFNNDLSKLIIWANRANSTDFASIAPFVIDYVKKKDKTAIYLIRQAAEEINLLATALTKDKPKIKIALFGGIAPFVKPWLSKSLRAKIMLRKHGATDAAVYLIRKKVKKIEKWGQI
jgi:glucosamine kinase